MKTEIVDTSETRKELKLEIEAEVVREAYDRISERYSKLANVPGFRRGHAPLSVIRTRFKEEIRSEVLRELVPPAIEEAITQSGLQILTEPDVHLDEDEENSARFGSGPIKLHVHLEVLPSVELGEYKGLEAIRRVRIVTDRDVEKMLESLREQSAALQPVEDRPSQLGDIVTVDFTGKFVAEPEAEEIKADEVDVELGSEKVQSEFTKNLTGVRPDDERTFTVKYPEDFSSKGLAGKEVNYTAKVTAVRVKVLPELDDEWARSLGEEFDSLETLRQKVRENLLQRAEHESRQRLGGEVMRKLVDEHPFEVPESFIEQQTSQNLQMVVRDMMNHGFDPRAPELDWAGVRESLREQSAREVRGSMLLGQIADTEKIEVTDEEVAAEIAEYAEATGQTPEQVRAALTKQGGERSIAERLRNRKALDLIIDNARVTDEEWEEEIEGLPELDADEDSADEAAAAADASTSTNAEAGEAGSETEAEPTQAATEPPQPEA